MTSEKLQKARDFETQYAPFADPERPLFHLTGPVGWINDPNGFSIYKGEYHLFFQYHPYSTKWGPMHWGHAKTRDFIHWKHLPVALAPDTEPDWDGCFSGSAVELEDGRHLLMYTGVYKIRRPDGVIDEIQQQCVAFGDGLNYEKYKANPVLDASDLPEGASDLDFRDPKLWRESNRFFAVIGSRPADGSGSVLLYESEDALHWHFVKVLEECRNEYGKMWECPDFFPLDGTHVILTSPQEMLADNDEFHAGFGTLCLLGSYESETYDFRRRSVQAIDYGIDFYAPQTLLTEDGRRVMVAWMQNWTTTSCVSPKELLLGAMTLPRELSVRNDRLYQNPVRELEECHRERVSYENILVDGETSLREVAGRVLDMTVRVRPADEKGYLAFKLNLAKDEKHKAVIRFKPSHDTIRIDRTHSGGRHDIVHTRDFPVRNRDGEIKLRVVMDRRSVELFVNDGEQAATFLLYSPESADGISFQTDGGAVLIDVEKFTLEL